ncbi:MAG: TM2 domain-containing protein [Flavobacteriales bacterium]
MRWVFIFLLFTLAGKTRTSAAGPYSVSYSEEGAIHRLDSLSAMVERTDASVQENERLMSVLLAIALGPFGGHRLYLGTGAKVPIFYTLTLGGGFGVLPTIDLFHLLLKKDLDPYRNNTQVFMWAKPRTEQLTQP